MKKGGYFICETWGGRLQRQQRVLFTQLCSLLTVPNYHTAMIRVNRREVEVQAISNVSFSKPGPLNAMDAATGLSRVTARRRRVLLAMLCKLEDRSSTFDVAYLTVNVPSHCLVVSKSLKNLQSASAFHPSARQSFADLG